MSRSGFFWLVAAVVLAATAGSLLLPGAREIVVVTAAVFLLGAAALSAVATAWRARPAAASPLDALLPPAPAPARPDDLVHLERLLGWKVYTRAEFDVRVAPVLGRVLAARLKQRFGVDVAAAPERARELIDPDLWALVEPADPGSQGPSVTTHDIAHLVERIESV